MTPCFIISAFNIAPESFPGGTHYLTEKIKLEPLSDEHKARISDYLDNHEEERLSRNVRKRPVIIVPYNEIHYLRLVVGSESKRSVALQIHRFALEYFLPNSLLMAIFSYDGGKISSHSVNYNDTALKKEADCILPNRVWEKHVAYLGFLYSCIDAAPAADIVINRLCRAFKQGPTDDGIIDLVIALERLVSAKMEIKFQFSLFHALINLDAPEDRGELFKILQGLYDIRSQTVHGGKPSSSDQKKIVLIRENWDRLLAVGRKNLTYYLLFCKKYGVKGWDNHLKDLSFGCSRISSDGIHDRA